MNEVSNAIKELTGSIRGAQIIVSREGVRPQFALDIVAGGEGDKVEILHVILDAPVRNAGGEEVNVFTASGVARAAIPSEVFVVTDGERMKVRKAEAAPRFLSDGKWTEGYAPTATKTSVKVTISHRVDVAALKAVCRNARRKDGESWVDIPAREVKANLPVGDTRVTVDGVKRYMRLVEGGTIRLLPLPAAAVSSQKATASGAYELED